MGYWIICVFFIKQKKSKLLCKNLHILLRANEEKDYPSWNQSSKKALLSFSTVVVVVGCSPRISRILNCEMENFDKAKLRFFSFADDEANSGHVRQHDGMLTASVSSCRRCVAWCRDMIGLSGYVYARWQEGESWRRRRCTRKERRKFWIKEKLDKKCKKKKKSFSFNSNLRFMKLLRELFMCHF